MMYKANYIIFGSVGLKITKEVITEVSSRKTQHKSMSNHNNARQIIK
jgi:hypothetical protein